jgi:hypothetical protein
MIWRVLQGRVDRWEMINLEDEVSGNIILRKNFTNFSLNHLQKYKLMKIFLKKWVGCKSIESKSKYWDIILIRLNV